jgi:hypothetical protein
MTVTATISQPPTIHAITAYIGDRPSTRAEVLAWEARRAAKVLGWLGAAVPVGDVETRRAAVVDAKLDLGRQEIERRLERQIRWSDRVTRAAARASKGRRRLSQIELTVPGAEAEQLPAWYERHARADDETAMLSACPDHLLFRPAADNRQEVIETTGGSPIASRFFFTMDEVDALLTPADPSFPVQIVGAARLADGTLIGGVRHQFRDDYDGLRARLTVEMPWAMGPYGPARHRWHLACEFSQWIEAAAAEAGTG